MCMFVCQKESESECMCKREVCVYVCVPAMCFVWEHTCVCICVLYMCAYVYAMCVCVCTRACAYICVWLCMCVCFSRWNSKYLWLVHVLKPGSCVACDREGFLWSKRFSFSLSLFLIWWFHLFSLAQSQQPEHQICLKELSKHIMKQQQ